MTFIAPPIYGRHLHVTCPSIEGLGALRLPSDVMPRTTRFLGFPKVQQAAGVSGSHDPVLSIDGR